MKVLIKKTAKFLVKKASRFLVKFCQPGIPPGAYCPDPNSEDFLPPPYGLPDPYGFLPWIDETCDPPSLPDPPEPPDEPLC